MVQDEEWGTGASPERIEDALRADRAHTIKGVLVVHNETATGVTSDVAAIRRAIDAATHPAMLYVDGVSSIASIDFRMDDWRVDLAVTGFSERADAPSRPRHRLRQRESASRQQERPLRADIFRLRRPDESKRHRLFSLYAFVAHALWTEGVLEHPVRGAAYPRVRAASGPRRWRARRGRRLGTAALRQGTKMVLEHSQRHHGAAWDRRRGCH